MCGLFGAFHMGLKIKTHDITKYKKIQKTLEHRGPDASSYWVNDQIFLGHQRLSIIDTSEGGMQPMVSNDGKLVIAFNGEIYNYLEIRVELKSLGYIFTTESDTEVLLYAWKHWGEKALLKLEGMFAGAIYNCIENKLILFRDYLGQKPLYWTISKSRLIFSSELRAIIGTGDDAYKLNMDAVSRYLYSSYFSKTDTPIQGVYKLESATLLENCGENNHIKKYWESIPGKDIINLSKKNAISRLDHLIKKSCQLASRSDVQMGVFLSGGVDSSILAKNFRELKNYLPAFTVSFNEYGFDESVKADVVAEHLNITHHEKFNINESNISEVMECHLSQADEPHGDPGFINSYFLAANIKLKIKVGISGDGADELLAGYISFLALRINKVLTFLPVNILRFLNSLISLIPQSDSYMSFKFKLECFVGGALESRNFHYLYWFRAIEFSRLKLVMRNLGGKTIEELFFSILNNNSYKQKSEQQKLLDFYQNTYLPEFICMHTDRAFMAHGIEVRSPFLSREIVEFCNKLPDKLRFNGGILKPMLRDIAKRNSLPKLVWGQKKHGFTFPVSSWLKTSLRHYLDDLISESANIIFKKLICRDELIKLIDEHLLGSKNNYRILLNLIALNAWLSKYDGKIEV